MGQNQTLILWLKLMQKNIKIENGQAWVLKKIQDDAQKGSE